MSGGRPRLVLYRRAVWAWSIIFGLAVTLTVAAVPGGARQVVAFTATGLGAVAAVMVWLRSDHRTGRPPRPDRRAGFFEPSGWRQAAVLALNVAVINLVGAGGPLLAWAAALVAAVTLTLPLQIQQQDRGRPEVSDGELPVGDRPIGQRQPFSE